MITINFYFKIPLSDLSNLITDDQGIDEFWIKYYIAETLKCRFDYICFCSRIYEATQDLQLFDHIIHRHFAFVNSFDLANLFEVDSDNLTFIMKDKNYGYYELEISFDEMTLYQESSVDFTFDHCLNTCVFIDYGNKD